MKKKIVLVLLLLLNLNAFAYEGKIAFDLDETLIESDKLDKPALKLAQGLGFNIQESKIGQDYIVRPGTFELLEYAKKLGFKLMIYTHNRATYARDILESANLMKYFDEVRSIEDCKAIYNMDFSRYPSHRNNVHNTEANTFMYFTKAFYQGAIKNSFKKFTGNKNIHPYIPCVNCDKYPPLYGARVLYDNSSYNIEDAIDFVGIKVKAFYANELEASLDGKYLWVEAIKKDLDYLQNHTWQEFYREKNKKEPLDNFVPLIKGIDH